MGPLCGISLWGSIDCPAPKWNGNVYFGVKICIIMFPAEPSY